LQTDNHLNFTHHTFTAIPKLSAACYLLRSTFHVSNTDTLNPVYFAYFHSIMKYGLTSGGGGGIKITPKLNKN
jgi:hypothetical protein